MKFCYLLFIFLISVANTFANDLDFTLVNETGRSFEGLYITASDNKDWDANILLDGKVLTAGGKISVRFKNDAESETWDFNLVDDEGLSVTFDKIRLAGVDTVTLKDVNGQMTAEIE
jgi:hypothetical protein